MYSRLFKTTKSEKKNLKSVATELILKVKKEKEKEAYNYRKEESNVQK